jgi:hypothetical protein
MKIAASRICHLLACAACIAAPATQGFCGAAPRKGDKSPRHIVLSQLPADFAGALQRQEFNHEKGRYQIGLGRNFDAPVSISDSPAGEWLTQADGSRVWTLQVTSEGALGARLHLEQVNLPAGATVFVFPVGGSSANANVITAATLAGNRDVWTETVFSQDITLECVAEAGANLNAITFTVTGLSHIFTLPQTQDPYLKEGTCHNDVTCYPNWAIQASGVARISFVDSGNSYLCSGCLLSSSVNSSVNYFLTAHHCIPSQSLASTMEWYWFYQTSKCNGAAPALSSVPTTTGGGDLLSTGVNSDYSLLKIKQSVPGGTGHLVWSTATPAANESLTGIHHPTGAYKRISFGKYYSSDSGFWAVQWKSGVTEPGSSGSPLFNASQEVIGQLNGGFDGPGSSCSNPSAPDQYGRFDVTYQSIKQWVGSDPNGGGGGGGGGNDVTVPKGTYYGLFSDPHNGVAQGSSGYAVITVNSRDGFSGSFQMGSSKLSCSGKFDGTGNAVIDISKGKFAGYAIALKYSSTGEDKITGTIGNGDFQANLTANRAFYDGKSNFAPEAGQYTIIIPGARSSSADPGGDSYGTVSVDKAGHVRLSGSLADGTTFSQSSALSANGEWPLYVNLYGGQGFLYSWNNFSIGGPAGTVSWIKQGTSRTKYYKSGFTLNSSINSSPYYKPVSGSSLLDLADGVVTFQGGDLSQTVSDEISVLFNNKVINYGDYKLSLSFSASKGTFSGKVQNPDTGKSLPFKGVILQDQNQGRGYFTGPTQTGEVTIGP